MMRDEHQPAEPRRTVRWHGLLGRWSQSDRGYSLLTAVVLLGSIMGAAGIFALTWVLDPSKQLTYLTLVVLLMVAVGSFAIRGRPWL